MIKSFRDEYYFLSNFYNVPVTWQGITYKNNEAAFQSAKVLDMDTRKCFTVMDARTAKSYGRRVKLRPNWHLIKYDIMYEICLAKFTQNNDLKEKLLATGNKHLEEGNTWGDRDWGTVNGVGLNKLGRILMTIRDELRKEKKNNAI